jgi:hypothetical protein
VRGAPGRRRDVDRVETGEEKAGDQGAREQIADAGVELIGEDDQHDARRNDLPERARRADHSGGQLR